MFLVFTLSFVTLTRKVCVSFPQYIETIDLSNLVSITDDNSQDRNLEAARLNLQLKDGNIKFTVRE